MHHAGDGVFDVSQQQAFGEFELEFAGVGVVVLEGLQHFGHEARLPELPGADVDRDGQVGGGFVLAPALQLFAGGLQHVLA
ncbi:hypothetical protein D3C72_1804310 [compost metagenome]